VFRSGPINGYGNSVVVESTAPDGTPFYELYGHLGPGPLPAPETEIVAGEPIPGATIGTKEYVQSTMGGLTSGPHLHREIISGKVRLNRHGGLGVYSSQIEHKADPEMFDINHAMFPYENHEPLPPPVPPDRSRNSAMPQPVGPATSSPSELDARSSPTTHDLPASQLSPGMPIPGAVGPTSIGGPNGPTPVVPPASSPPRPPLRLSPRSETILPRQNLNSVQVRDFGPFASAGPLSSDVSTLLRTAYTPGYIPADEESLLGYSRPAISPDAAMGGGADLFWDGTRGLLGLLAQVTGETPPNPFEQGPLEEVVPVRRLISRPAHY